MNCPMCGELWNGHLCHTCGWAEVLTVALACGGKRCPVDGDEHDLSVMRKTADGGTLVCSKCGISAMNLDLLGAP